jgi:hypothetical protein
VCSKLCERIPHGKVSCKIEARGKRARSRKKSMFVLPRFFWMIHRIYRYIYTLLFTTTLKIQILQ